MSRSLRRLILTTAVVPLVMLVGLRSAWAAYACRMDGEVRSACCCPRPTTKAAHLADEAPRVAARCCCDVTIHQATQAPSVREAVRAGLDAPFISIDVVPALASRSIASIDRVRPDSARPPPPPVIGFLEKRAILR